MKYAILILAGLLLFPQWAISENKACDGATTQMFGVHLKCATRGSLRKAIQAAGNNKSSISPHEFRDRYNRTSNLVDKTRYLDVFFTNSGLVAQVKYNFYTLGRKGMKDIFDMVSYKYGKPTTTKKAEEVSSGKDYIWKLKDGIIILLSEYGDGINLTYTNPKAYKVMEREKLVFEEKVKKKGMRASAITFET